MYDEALREAGIVSRGENSPIFMKYARSYVAARRGRRDEALELISEVERDYVKENFSPYQIAGVHFLAGDTDGGFLWLARSYDERDGWIHIMAADYQLDSVRGDPRYLDLLRKVGLGKSAPRA